MATEIEPEARLEPQSQPWARWVTSTLKGARDGLARLIGEVKRLTSDTATNFNRQQEQIAELRAVATIESAEFTSAITGFTGWYGAAPAGVFIYSPTNRMEIGFGGSVNGGDGYFAYQVTNVGTGAVVIAKESVQASPAKRVAVTGGASFTPSGWKTTVISVPEGVTLEVGLWINTSSTFTYFAGGFILARPVPSTLQLPTI